MNSRIAKQKGAALLIVLTAVLISVLFAEVVLNIMNSQARLTHHQVSRIQAYYAAQAGTILALEYLRQGLWQAGQNYCINCKDPTTVLSSNRFSDPQLTDPYGNPIVVNISIGPVGASAGSAAAIPGSAPISATVDYTYTP